MSKLTVFRQQASVGSHVTLRLTRGDDVSGRIDQLDDAYVSVDRGDGKIVTIFADILAGWELHLDAGVVSEDRRERLPSPAAHDEKHVSDGEHEKKSAVDSTLARIEAKFSEAVKRARLELLEPDFQFPNETFSSKDIDAVRREWDRARNQYDYALKVKEPHRLNNVIAQILTPLAENHPDSAATRSLLGRVFLKLNRQSEAMDHLATAAALSEAPEHWLALASAAEEGSATECYALRRYFGLTPPSDAKEAWFRYLAAANPIDLKGTIQIINRWSADTQQENDSPDLLLSESLIFLLLSTDSPSLARQAAANLMQADRQLPTGWQDALDRSTAPSEELRAVELRFTRSARGVGSRGTATSVTPDQIRAVQRRFTQLQPIPPDEGANVHLGLIKSFGNQRFGFIHEHRGGIVFFFRIDDVTDKALQDVLLDGGWRTAGEVEFNVHPSPGHKYDHATSVVRRQSRDSLLQRARDHLDTDQHSQAMACVRRVLRADPTDEEACQLEEKIKQDLQKKLRDRGTGLPKGTGPYARARRAQLVDQDPENAEKFLKQAVRENDKKGSAIKDLASLLQQRGRAQEAISLLTEHVRQFQHDVAYDNMLATLYQHANRHDDAIDVLIKLLDSAESNAKKVPLLKRLAYSHIKCARYDKAERALQTLLATNPHDRTAARWLAGLEDARNSESEAEAEEVIESLGELGEEGLELSSIAHAAIEQCTYKGVDPKKLQAGTAGDKDVERVVKLAMKLGIDRPRDRAGYYLSAAALLKRDSGNGRPGRIYAYLRRYFASMADASWTEKKPADVVRSYYVESLGLVSENVNLDEAWRSLWRYLKTFSPDPLDKAKMKFPTRPRGRPIPRDEYTGAIRRTLEMTMPNTSWMEGLIAVGSQSSFARTAISNAVQASQSLQAAFGSLLDDTGQEKVDGVYERWQWHCREYARIDRKRLFACRTLTNYRATVASMEDLRNQLVGFSEKKISAVDRRRLTSLIDIAESALAFCYPSDFEEKERNYLQFAHQVDYFRKDVIDAPTQYSHEGLLPIADHLKSLMDEDYARMVETSGAELSLRLLVDRYVRRQDGELSLQIEVANKTGCSPASSIRICLGPEDSEYFDADNRESKAISTLRGGSAEVTQMTVRPRDAAMQDRAFLINAMAAYQNSLGETVRTVDHAWTVKLYSDDDFRHLDNHYAPFAEGGPVDKPDMFVGRGELLDRLEHSLLAGSASKSIVMFGQKRAGKSSLIEHLGRRLAGSDRVISVCFSMQDIASDLSVTAFLHRILQSASDVLEELRFDGRAVPDFSPPAIDEMESHPETRFHGALTSLVRDMRRHPSHLSFVFLVDEFTDIFKEIKRGRIPSQFMKTWKAIIEKKYFASVLVGQDIMPAFKAAFPNEFGVTEDIRVTYLDETAATTLVEKPIGKDRFAGCAVKRLLDLTAGSPYYTMMFCARLVDYMNTTRSMIVTEADIRAVEEEMLRGERRLTKDKFDNLLSAGDGMEDSGIDPDETYTVCAAIARGSGKETWCSRHVIPEYGEADLDRLLQDLETRDVVERKEDAYRLRVGLFKDWLMANQG